MRSLRARFTRIDHFFLRESTTQGKALCPSIRRNTEFHLSLFRSPTEGKRTFRFEFRFIGFIGAFARGADARAGRVYLDKQAGRTEMTQ